MKRKTRLLAGAITLSLILVAVTACARGAATLQRAPEEGFALDGADVAEEPMAFEEAAEAEMMAVEPASGIGGGVAADQSLQQERLIIRTADLSLVVDDTLQSLENIADVANAMGGFVVNSNSYQGGSESAYFGNISVRVPAERFDEAIDQVKGMAVEVRNETVSGQDVTEEFVDLEARVTNLRVAEQQLQEIMDNAQDTEDVLAVYNQLIQIRGEIESIEGRMQYLSESARLSTINVNLEPNIITQPVDVRWKPLETIKLALQRLGRTLAGVVDGLINLIIVVVPTLLVIALVIGLVVSPFYFLVRGIVRRRRNRGQEN